MRAQYCYVVERVMRFDKGSAKQCCYSIIDGIGIDAFGEFHSTITDDYGNIVDVRFAYVKVK